MDQGPKPVDLDARLAAIERILANIDARITVNEELARRNVALTGHVAPEPQQPSADRLVTVRVTDDSAELLANSCTFDMRAELKKARAVWRADAPARWSVPRQAWDASCEAWKAQFGVTFALEPQMDTYTLT